MGQDASGPTRIAMQVYLRMQEARASVYGYVEHIVCWRRIKISAYIEYGDTIAFHPGWYVKEIMDESNFDDEDFAGMLGMTAEELRLVVSVKRILRLILL